MKKGSGLLFVVSAPSGAGKTTLVTKVIERLKGDHAIQRVITYTSKQPRPGEIQGVDYHFLTEAEFIGKIKQNFFVEYSTVYGAYYGFPKDVFDAIDEGQHFIAIVDRAGAASLKAYRKDAVLIWIKPPGKGALAERLISRAQDSQGQIAFRLALAQQEMARQERDELFEHVILNDSLEAALDRLEEIINKALLF